MNWLGKESTALRRLATPLLGGPPQEGSGMEMTGRSETKLGFTSLRNPPKEWNKGLISHFGFCMCPEEAPLPQLRQRAVPATQ